MDYGIVTACLADDIIRTLEVVKVGSKMECESFLFHKIAPSDSVRNVEKLESDTGYCYQVETFYNNQWNKEIYHYFVK